MILVDWLILKGYFENMAKVKTGSMYLSVG